MQPRVVREGRLRLAISLQNGRRDTTPSNRYVYYIFIQIKNYTFLSDLIWVDGCVDDGVYALWCPTGALDPLTRHFSDSVVNYNDWDYCGDGCALHNREMYGCGDTGDANTYVRLP